MPGEASFSVVGIGASAGGLEAFKNFLRATPPDTGMAFVLIQHLDPTHESLTAELLSKQTAMEVEQVTADVPLRPNRVYVIPPNKYLSVKDGNLALTDFGDLRTVRMPVDFFLRSLAEGWQERAVGIILSGTGSDGTLGVKEIKGAGGLVLVQDPATAAYDGMPLSAIATGAVDYVLPVEELPAQMLRAASHWRDGEEPSLHVEKPDSLGAIVALLRARAGFDFRPYKKATLRRRLHRRMTMRHLDEPSRYLEVLRNDPDEVKALSSDFLIGVTSFFRDPPAWDYLERSVIPRLLAEANPSAPIRVWVAGCSTGEEAYSLAMILLEQDIAARQNREILVFASDVDREALEVARTGTYRESIAAEVSTQRLRRFFTKVDGSFRVTKELRESVTFAEQNLITDPPFSKLHLISCRNLLIYLEDGAQERVVSLLHFALAEGGYLFLGNAETIGQAEDLFEPISKKWRIYRRIGPGRPDKVRFPVQPAAEHPPTAPVPAEMRRTAPRLSQLFQETLLNRYAPASVIVNRRYEILYYSGPVQLYLAHPPGPPTHDLIDQAREGLQAKLRATVHRAIQEKQPVVAEGVRVRRNGDVHKVRISAEPLRDRKETEGLLLVSFVDEPEQEPAAGQAALVAPRQAEESLTSQLEYELKTTREDLQSTIEELETLNEEFKAANEEVMSVNEELQSTNEELETSKEELQSLNEELNTINVELRTKVEELERTNNDLDNLLTSTDLATLFLDRELRIKRYTPATKRLFNVIPSDVGRPIADITQNFSDPTFLGDAAAVLERLLPKQQEIRTNDGQWYARQILPYRTRDERIDGLVVTFSTVAGEALQEARTRAEASADALRESEARLRGIVETATEGIFTVDERAVVQSFNPAAEKIFGYRADEVVGKNLKVLMPSPYHEKSDRFVLKHLASEATRNLGRPREVMGRRKGGTEFPMELAVSEFHDHAGRVFSGIVRDISERKRVEEALRESEGRLRGMADAMPLLASFVDAQQRYQFNNAAYEAWFGIPRESLRGMRVRQVIGAKAYRAVRGQIEAALAGRPAAFEGELSFGDGKVRTVHVDYAPERDVKGRVTGFYTVTRDITVPKQMEERERELARVLRVSTVNELASGLAHEISQPLSAIANDLEAALKRVQAGADRARIVEILKDAAGQARRAGEVVRYLRQFMRKREPAFEMLDLRELVQSVVTLISRSVEKTRTALDVELGAVPLPVRVDRVQIEQVILNLIQNAIEAMATKKRDGRIVAIRAEAKGSSAELTITDAGSGMSPAARERLFEPFFTTKPGGLGLGLAVSRSLVEGHHGQLTLSPRPDGRSGAVARLTLPLHPAGRHGRKREVRAPRAPAKRRRR